MLLSCSGTRKTSLTKHRIETDTLSINNSVVLKQNIELRDIQQLNPFDASKPIRINGKDYFNVSIVFDKSKFSNFEIEKNINAKSGSIKEEVKIKETEKTDYTILVLGAILIIGAFIFLWFYLKKYTLAR